MGRIWATCNELAWGGVLSPNGQAAASTGYLHRGVSDVEGAAASHSPGDWEALWMGNGGRIPPFAEMNTFVLFSLVGLKRINRCWKDVHVFQGA